MKDLDGLLLLLVRERPSTVQYQQWQVQKIGGSANNLLYRATGVERDLAIKFTIRDARRRAYREYLALSAVAEVALGLAPKPILLDETSYELPVVVQTWLEGEVTAVPPQTDQEWQYLIDHYASLAKVTPAKVTVPLATAVINFTSIAHAHQHIRRQLDSIPAPERPASLQNLLSRLVSSRSSNCPAPPTLALCRNDSNTLNFIRQPNQWLSVDWENSGWGDPAFEIVDVICHPQYASVSAERWEGVAHFFGELSGDEAAVARIHAYTPLMLIWWAVRLARAAYEIPRGLDERLVERPSNWQSHNQTLYTRYLELATLTLDQLP